MVVLGLNAVKIRSVHKGQVIFGNSLSCLNVLTVFTQKIVLIEL